MTFGPVPSIALGYNGRPSNIDQLIDFSDAVAHNLSAWNRAPTESRVAARSRGG